MTTNKRIVYAQFRYFAAQIAAHHVYVLKLILLKRKKFIELFDPEIPERADSSIVGCGELCRELRIENTLMDEKGNEEKKNGAPVEVTIEADAKDTEAKSG